MLDSQSLAFSRDPESCASKVMIEAVSLSTMSEFSRSCRPMLLILGLPPRSEGRLAVAIRGMSGYGMVACGAKRPFVRKQHFVTARA